MEQEKEHFAWTFRAYEQHERTMLWYVVAGLCVGLFLILSYYTDNLLFGILVLLTTFVLLIRHVAEPGKVQCELNRNGIRVGDKIYPFESLRFFWLLPSLRGYSILYIEERRGLRSILPVPIHRHDPDEIAVFLRKFVEEQKERPFEPLLERLARILKL